MPRPPRFAILLAFLALAAAGVGAFVVVGSGGDGSGSGEAKTAFAGTGYEFTIPKGWVDETGDAASVEDLGLDEPAAEGIDVDAVVAARAPKSQRKSNKSSASGKPGGEKFRPNLTVVRTSDGVPAGATAKELARANLRTSRQLGELPSGAGGGSVSFKGSRIQEGKLDGEPVASYEQVADFPAGKVRQRQIYAVHAGFAFALTYGALEGKQFRRNLAALDEILDSWSWE